MSHDPSAVSQCQQFQLMPSWATLCQLITRVITFLLFPKLTLFWRNFCLKNLLIFTLLLLLIVRLASDFSFSQFSHPFSLVEFSFALSFVSSIFSSFLFDGISFLIVFLIFLLNFLFFSPARVWAGALTSPPLKTIKTSLKSHPYSYTDFLPKLFLSRANRQWPKNHKIKWFPPNFLQILQSKLRPVSHGEMWKIAK